MKCLMITRGPPKRDGIIRYKFINDKYISCDISMVNISLSLVNDILDSSIIYSCLKIIATSQ